METRFINLRYWSWIGLCTAAIFVALKAVPYVTTDTSFFDPIFRDKYVRHLAIVLTHGQKPRFQSAPQLTHGDPRK